MALSAVELLVGEPLTGGRDAEGDCLTSDPEVSSLAAARRTPQCF